MAALTLKEAARFPAESLQAAQFRHGPLELAGPGLAAVVFASERRTLELDLGLAAELAAPGAAVLVIGPDGSAPDGATGIATGELAAGSPRRSRSCPCSCSRGGCARAVASSPARTRSPPR